MDKEITDKFDEIFVRHYERLTGARNAVGGLPFNTANIGCLIILGGRELEMSDVMSEVSERYSMDEFIKEIKEAGMKSEEAIRDALNQLKEKKYLDLRPDGIIYSFQDTKDTARTLNRIYPKMQGINLLAYMWQTIAEAASGRTDLATALDRFDQTLNNHGVAIPKPKIPKIIPDAPKLKPQPKEEKPSVIGSSGRRIYRDYVVAKEAVPSIPTAKKPEPAEPLKTRETALSPEAPPAAEIKTAPEIPASVQQEAGHLTAKAPPAPPEEKQRAASGEPAEKEETIPSPAPEEKGTPVDDVIAEKIAAFEKELALVCPICKTGVLAEKSTAAGKKYYACASENCNFISWGKPHHIECSRCKNPFLVEMADSTGQVILKCPRATCQHKQPLNARVKLVRKRVVRRAK
ncbi:MAG TPA: hypothetical protein PKZ12_01930 [Smithellaceae bacterium]|nr:hypothetical protein [Smithellaceae bacterium]